LLLIIISGVLGSWFRSSPPPSPAVKPRDDSGPIAACSSRSVESKFFDLALDHYRVNSVLYRSKPMDRGGYCLVTFEDDAGKRLGSLRYSVSGHDNPDVVVNVIDWE
jgi:hypothetical protein